MTDNLQGVQIESNMKPKLIRKENETKMREEDSGERWV